MVLVLCDIGDEVITVTPNFPPTLDIISALGAERRTVKLSFSEELMQQLVLAKMNTVISCSVVDEVLALEVLRQRHTLLESRQTLLADAVKLTAEWMAHWSIPRNAWKVRGMRGLCGMVLISKGCCKSLMAGRIMTRFDLSRPTSTRYP